MAARVVVLVSGSGTNLQALLDAQHDESFPAEVVAVGSDRAGIEALTRAKRAATPTFEVVVDDFTTRASWDSALTEQVGAFDPELVVLAGFMKLVGQTFLQKYAGRVINTHPALLPSFPGAYGVRDALDYGVSLSGCTIFLVDDGVDTGPIVAQAAVPVLDGDTEAVLHERIKKAERDLLVRAVSDLVTRPHHVEGRKVVWS